MSFAKAPAPPPSKHGTSVPTNFISAPELCRSVSHLHIASRCVLDRLVLRAAGLTRGHGRAVLLLDPVDPVRPPRARMLRRLLDPLVEAADRIVAGPVLVLHLLARWIDHAGNVA